MCSEPRRRRDGNCRLWIEKKRAAGFSPRGRSDAVGSVVRTIFGSPTAEAMGHPAIFGSPTAEAMGHPAMGHPPILSFRGTGF